jgi:hypothetical protein
MHIIPDKKCLKLKVFISQKTGCIQLQIGSDGMTVVIKIIVKGGAPGIYHSYTALSVNILPYPCCRKILSVADLCLTCSYLIESECSISVAPKCLDTGLQGNLLSADQAYPSAEIRGDTTFGHK